MTNQFDSETALTLQSPGQWTGQIDRNWNIGANPNGGYLVAIAMTALRELAPEHPDPLTLTVHYLRPGSADQSCDVQAEVIRAGRTLTTARASLSQDGKQRLQVLAGLGKLGETSEPTLTIPAPKIPPPEQCVVRTSAGQGVDVKILERLDIRLHPEHASGNSIRSELSGWVRFKDGRVPDTHACLLFVDALPPSIFSLLGAVGWVPTVELSVHVRRRPTAGWMQAKFTTADLADGRLIEDGLLWDEQGNLIAQSRQLALLLK